VNLARHLAIHGFNCFRIDIEGIGDSVLRGAGKENYPYPDTAVSDTQAALDYLKTTWNASEFALLGLCSGAYTAFHAGVQLPASAAIKHVVSINPLTFHWIEGETLLTTQAFKQDLWAVNHYKSSALSLQRWKKLLSGKADLKYIVQMVVKQTWKKCVAFMHALPEVLTMSPQKKLGREIQALLKANRSLSFFIASGDPGYELLVRDGGYFAKRLVQTRRISVKHIANSDHTFSRLTPKTHLIEAVTENLSQHFGA
jgi:pimeloyl-ACP methyl ester carboxylesterase